VPHAPPPKVQSELRRDNLLKQTAPQRLSEQAGLINGGTSCLLERSIMTEQSRFVPVLLGWVLPYAKREFGQMLGKALDFWVARCWGGVGQLVPGRSLCWAPKGCRGTR